MFIVTATNCLGQDRADLYLKPGGRFTTDIEEAKIFRSSSSASRAHQTPQIRELLSSCYISNLRVRPFNDD